MRGRSSLRQANTFGPNAPYLGHRACRLVFAVCSGVPNARYSRFWFDLRALPGQGATEIANSQSRLVLVKPAGGMHSSSVKIKRTKVDAW